MHGVLDLVEDQCGEPGKGQQHHPTYRALTRDTLDFVRKLGPRVGEESLHEVHEVFVPDAVMADEEPEDVQEEEDQGQDGEQGKKRDRGCERAAATVQKIAG